jgi:hypothetical protein
MGVIWAIAWIPLSLVSIAVISWRFGAVPPLPILTGIVLTAITAGGASGLVFGGLLAVAERRRTFAALPRGRFALWGVVASLVPPLLTLLPFFLRAIRVGNFGNVLPMVASVVGLNGVFGAVCAGTLLYLARRSPPLPGEQEGAGEIGPGSA